MLSLNVVRIVVISHPKSQKIRMLKRRVARRFEREIGAKRLLCGQEAVLTYNAKLSGRSFSIQIVSIGI
jgi:hypothetical protein